jgi:hypothetical protein
VTVHQVRKFCDLRTTTEDGTTHTCAKHTGHLTGSHECVCGRSWWAWVDPDPDDEDYWSAAW